jgi:hypothetical protein
VFVFIGRGTVVALPRPPDRAPDLQSFLRTDWIGTELGGAARFKDHTFQAPLTLRGKADRLRG